MHSIRVHETGDSDALRYEEVPIPSPGPAEARVKIQAAGVNFIDIYHRKGQYGGDLPFTPGVEAAGTVDALGSEVSGLKEGDRVAYAMQIGAYAEYAVVPSWKLVRLPENMDAKVGAALTLQGMTAHYLCYSTYPLAAGETALVHAAAGGVGLLLVQIAKRCGARVIGTVSTEEKERLARQAGADEIIRYTEQDFEAEVKRLTDGRGVNVVYDSVGQTTFDQSLNCLKPRGYMVLYGQSSGPARSIDPQELNQKGSLFLTRPTLLHYAQDAKEIGKRMGDLIAWVESGALSARIDTTFALSEAAAAHRYMEGRKSRGKVLLIP